MKALLLLSGLAAVRAQSSYYGGGLGDPVPDTCYRAIEHEIQLINAEMEKLWKDHHVAECKKTEDRDRVELELDMLASEIFVLTDEAVRCQGPGGNCGTFATANGPLSATMDKTLTGNFKASSTEHILTTACDADGTVDFGTAAGTASANAAAVEASFDGVAQAARLANGMVNHTTLSTKPTQDTLANPSAFISAKTNLKTYAEASVKYCYEVFRIDQNLQALLKVKENQIQDAAQGGHFFLQMNSQGKMRVNATARGTDADCAAAKGETDCGMVSVEQNLGMRPPWSGAGAEPEGHNYGGVSYCTWTGTECKDMCADGDPADCGATAMYCRADGANCKSMMKDIDLELRKCMDAKLEVEAKKAAMDLEESKLEQHREMYLRALGHWEEAQKDLNLRHERLDGLCKKAKAARKVWAGLYAISLDTASPGAISDFQAVIQTLSTAQLELSRPEFRHHFQQSSSPQNVENGLTFIQSGMKTMTDHRMKSKVVEKLHGISAKTGLKMADNVASFIQADSEEEQEQPTLLTSKVNGEEVAGTIMYVINSREEKAQEKVAALELKRDNCNQQLASAVSAVEVDQSEYDEAKMTVHKQRAQKDLRQQELYRAQQEEVAATTAYTEADADWDQWVEETNAEVEEARQEAVNMFNGNQEMYKGLESSTEIDPETTVRLKAICNRVYGALQDRLGALEHYQTTESARQKAIVDVLEGEKTAAQLAKNAANIAFINARDALGREETSPTHPATGSVEQRDLRQGELTNSKDALKDKRLECVDFLGDIEERVDAEKRQIQGLHELKGVLDQLVTGAHTYRTAAAQDWQTQTAGLDGGAAAEACLNEDDKATCQADTNCKWVDGLFCYPDLQTPDGVGYFGTVPGASPAGEVVKANDQSRLMSDFMDDLQSHALPHADYEGTRVRVPDGDTAQWNDPIDFGDGSSIFDSDGNANKAQLSAGNNPYPR